jgi:hypothetical protein
MSPTDDRFSPAGARPLSSSHHATILPGDTVVADDGAVGEVEQVLRSETAEPMFVVVSVRKRLRRRHPVIPFSLLGRVDNNREIVRVRGPRDAIKDLSEALPLLV